MDICNKKDNYEICNLNILLWQNNRNYQWTQLLFPFIGA